MKRKRTNKSLRQKRRGNNEGTIYEERKGRWIAQLRLGYELRNGKRRPKRKKFVGRTRAAVQRKLTAALHTHQTGGLVPIQKSSLGQFLKAWLGTLGAKGRSEKTISSYTWVADKYIIPELGTIALTRLTQSDLNEYMHRKLEAGLSARTIQYCHAIIRSALSKAERDGLVARNVAKLAELPTALPNKRVEPLSLPDAKKFLAAAAGHRFEALYSVAMAIGLRRGEILGLRWLDVDLERGLIQVSQTIQRIKGRGMVASSIGKTKKSLRTVPLPAFAVEKLRNHLDRQKQEREFAGAAWKDSGLVFTSAVGTPIEPSNLSRDFHSLLDALKIQRRRFHDLRHTAATLLLSQGASLHDVKEILGHSQIALTANLYGHAYTSVLRETVDKVGAMFDGHDLKAPQMAPLADSGKPN